MGGILPHAPHTLCCTLPLVYIFNQLSLVMEGSGNECYKVGETLQ